jgi:hypothetical protein
VSTVSRRCRVCRKSFEGEPWQHLCWDCWRREKDGGLEQRGYERGLTAGRAEARRAYLRGLAEGRVKEAAAHPATPPIADDLIRDPLWLVHPDHQPPERSGLANRVTATLLTLRESVRRASMKREDGKP